MVVRQHGWKSSPSPRRGFTIVAASRDETSSPVVVAVHDALQAVRLFRTAAEEAMTRCRHLLVLDYGDSSLHEALDNPYGDIDARERSTLRTLLSNPHVRVVRIEPVESDLERTIAYCESVRACMLVLGADHIGSHQLDASLASRIFDAEFDVLVLADPEGRRDDVSQPAGTG